ncbi:uncharacterized protein LOC111051284 isoform X2 [Nilaparvata lugens]|uniref:uncharacterized protein LOC111051284 isoform X2 n=1 Tax=Nilaparvata lugens TaxID=108931 RepID=UPI00193CFF51|nr:uncharacterized protein LOC111051284 isoform X2 [Nilaparvata lugens]
MIYVSVLWFGIMVGVIAVGAIQCGVLTPQNKQQEKTKPSKLSKRELSTCDLTSSWHEDSGYSIQSLCSNLVLEYREEPPKKNPFKD